MKRQRKQKAARCGVFKVPLPVPPNPDLPLISKMIVIEKQVQFKKLKHLNYCTELKSLYEQITYEAFKTELTRYILLLLTYEESNNYVSNCLSFVTMFLCKLDEENRCKHIEAAFLNDEEEDCEMLPLLQHVMTRVAQVSSSSNPTVRYWACYLLSSLMNGLGDTEIDDELFNLLKVNLINRTQDISIKVRVQAIRAIHRLQEPMDPDNDVMKVLYFHLGTDPSPKVRVAVVEVIAKTKEVQGLILRRITDTDENVRKQAIKELTTYPHRQMKIVERLKLLHAGLTDQSHSVKWYVEQTTLPKWLDDSENVLDLLNCLLITGTDSERTKYYKVVERIVETLIRKRDIFNVLQELPFSPETKTVSVESISSVVIIFWRTLAEYALKNNEDLDEVIPELTTLVDLFQQYLEYKIDIFSKTPDPFLMAEFSQTQFEFVKMFHTYDLSDEVGRGNLKVFLIKLLMASEHNIKLIESIVEILKKVCEDSTQWQEEIIECVTDIYNPEVPQVQIQTNASLENVPAQGVAMRESEKRALQVKLSSLNMDICNLNEEQVAAIEERRYEEAERLENQLKLKMKELDAVKEVLFHEHVDISELHSELADLKQQQETALFFKNFARNMELAVSIEKIENAITNLHSATTKVVQVPVIDITEDIREITKNPLQIKKALAIILSMLTYDIPITPPIKMTFETTILPIMDQWKDNNEVMYLAHLCTSCICLMDLAIAKKYFPIYYTLLHYYDHENKLKFVILGLQVVFNLFVQFGMETFDVAVELPVLERTVKNTTIKRRQLFSVVENSEIISSKDDSNDSENDNLHATFWNPDLVPRNFVSLVSLMMENSVDKEIQTLVVHGLCQMILTRRISSKTLMAKLLVMYYNTLTAEPVVQYIGSMLKYVSEGYGEGPEEIADALFPALEIITNAPDGSSLRDILPFNIIKLVMNLTQIHQTTGHNCHSSLALYACEQLLKLEDDDCRAMDMYYGKVLSLCVITENDTSLLADLGQYLPMILERISTQTNVHKSTISLIKKTLNNVKETLGKIESRIAKESTVNSIQNNSQTRDSDIEIVNMSNNLSIVRLNENNNAVAVKPKINPVVSLVDVCRNGNACEDNPDEIEMHIDEECDVNMQSGRRVKNGNNVSLPEHNSSSASSINKSDSAADMQPKKLSLAASVSMPRSQSIEMEVDEPVPAQLKVSTRTQNQIQSLVCAPLSGRAQTKNSLSPEDEPNTITVFADVHASSKRSYGNEQVETQQLNKGKELSTRQSLRIQNRNIIQQGSTSNIDIDVASPPKLKHTKTRTVLRPRSASFQDSSPDVSASEFDSANRRKQIHSKRKLRSQK